MKLIFSLYLVLCSIQFVCAQNSGEKPYSFTDIVAIPKIDYESELLSLDTSFDDTKSFSFFDATNNIDFKPNSEELNTKLFSNIKIIENTYKDYSDFFSLCSPLDDGIANNVNSGDRMLSMVLNNFINNVLFKDRGPLTRLLSSKN
ncbi:hypothetical protein [Winogradskyella sp.]|uniref:hypothetical protein n=1 Tax=Winogradskyella sp. TaxID=1883156 RepID=UPI00262738B6|nr:hypothetical protein [Winogradskyella sp.]